jgi:hypothetical protein
MSLDEERRLRDIQDRLTVRQPETAGGAGTAFPTGIAAGFMFFRTDLGFLCYYDGTRWLTVHEYSATLVPYGRSAQPYSGGAGTLLIYPVRTDYVAYYTRAKAYLDVLTTNNGTNFWSFTLTVGATAAWAFNTSADAAGTALNKEDTTGGVTAGTTFAKLDVSSKTGAPGTLAINVTYWYRLIVT